MTGSPAEWNGRIAHALEGCAAAVEPTAPGRWAVGLHTDPPQHASAFRDGDWLLFDAAAGADALDWPARSLELLARTAQFPGVVKYAATDAARLRVRAEVLLTDALDLSALVRSCLGSLAMAMAADGQPRAAAREATPTVDLERLCTETGWAFTPRPPGCLMMPLDVGRAFAQAALTLDPERGAVASVPLTGAGTCGAPPCEQAVAMLALRTAGAVRMVRAAASPGEGMRFEVELGWEPVAAALGCALAALSVAWELAGREAEVLARDLTVATQYVELMRPVEARHGQ